MPSWREVFPLPKDISGVDEWFEEINNLLWQFILAWVRDENDMVGASHVAIALSKFYGNTIYPQEVMELWGMLRSGKCDTARSPLVCIQTLRSKKSSQRERKTQP